MNDIVHCFSITNLKLPKLKESRRTLELAEKIILIDIENRNICNSAGVLTEKCVTHSSEIEEHSSRSVDPWCSAGNYTQAQEEELWVHILGGGGWGGGQEMIMGRLFCCQASQREVKVDKLSITSSNHPIIVISVGSWVLHLTSQYIWISTTYSTDIEWRQ